MTDYGAFQRGIKRYPLSADASTSMLRRADPFVFYALEYAKKMIETHLGAALLGVADGTPVKAAVGQLSAVDPTHFLSTAQYKFPLLACYRKRGKFEDRTVGRRHSVVRFELLYVFPPLNAGQAEKLVPALAAIADVLDDRFRAGHDPAYTPTGGTANQSPWELCRAELARLEESEWGLLQGLDQQIFFGLKLTGSISERADDATSGMDDFAGADVSVDFTDQDGSKIPDIAQLATLQPPEVTAVAPTSGSHLGNVPLTITGKHFQAPARVWVAGQLALNVVVVNATTITCTTEASHPRVVGAVADIEVETDFGSNALVNAFTFT